MFEEFPVLCECKIEKGRRLYDNYNSWIEGGDD